MVVIELVARATVVLAGALILVRVLERRSAALRHAVLAASLAGAALTPVLGLMLPAWHIEVAAQAPPLASQGTDGAPHQAAPRSPTGAASLPGGITGRLEDAVVPWLAAGLWAAGALAGFGMLALALLRLGRLTARATPAEPRRWLPLLDDVKDSRTARRHVRLLVTTELDVPATWGVWQPVILLPATSRHWVDTTARVVLAHELAHVKRHDWVVQFGAECLKALYWWNPLFWITCRRLQRESERACDDDVLHTGVQAAAYARCVMQFAREARHSRTPGWPGAMPIARPPALERRITAMLNLRTNRTPLSRGLTAVAIALATLVVVPGATLRLSSAQAHHLEGSVYDTSGAVLPEVALTLRDAADQSLTAFTDAEGHFVFPSVAAGTYVLEAQLRGFKALTQEFTLSHPKDWDRSVILQVGTLRESIHVTAGRATPETASGTRQQPTRLRVGGNIRAPRKLVDVKPVYPTSMREAEREGDVSLEAIVGTDGAVHSVRVLGAHVHPDFAIAASDAVRQWRFSPTLLNGTPIEVVINVSVAFSLQD